MALSETDKDKINHYAFLQSMQARGPGMWAGSLFGLSYGVLAGAAAALLIPAITAILPGVGAVAFSAGLLGKSALLLGTIGLLQGRAAGGENGSNAGAASGIIRRMTLEMRSLREQIKGIDPNAPSIEEPPLPEPEPYPKFRWKTFLSAIAIGITIGVMVGGLLALGGTLPAVKAIFDIFALTNTAQIMVAGGVIGAASSGFFGFNVPAISNDIHMWARSVLSGKAFEKEPAKTPELTLVNDKIASNIQPKQAIEKQMESTPSFQERMLKERQIPTLQMASAAR